MRIIIAGSRDFDDYKFVRKNIIKIFKILKEENPNISRNDIEIISGHARGIDKLGEKFAIEYGIKLKIFPAVWDSLGLSAGAIRNIDMADYALEQPNPILIAFRVNNSKGTTNMIRVAKQRGIKSYVIEVNYVEKEETDSGKRIGGKQK